MTKRRGRKKDRAGYARAVLDQLGPLKYSVAPSYPMHHGPRDLTSRARSGRALRAKRIKVTLAEHA